MTALPFTAEQVRRILGQSTFAKGAAYQQSGRVLALSLEEEGFRLTGSVLGSSREPYAVRVQTIPAPRSPVLRGTCTCPLRYDCKHVAALLLEALARSSRRSSSSDEPLAGAVDLWLRDLALAARNVVEPPSEVIVYLLDLKVRRFAPNLAIEGGVARVKQDGSVGAIRPYRLENLETSSAGWIQAKDLTVGRLLRASGLYGALGASLDPSFLGTLLRNVIATGRAYWKTADHPPLREAPPRTGRLVWRPSDDGRQRAVVEGQAPGTVLLPAAPPWYVDPATGEAGPLELGLQPDVAAALVCAPPLTAAQIPRVRRALDTELRSLGIDGPAESIDESVIQEDPVPQLRLASESHDVAYLTFAYGDAVIELDAPLDECRIARDGGLVRWPRRHRFEHACRDRLVAAFERCAIATEPASPGRASTFVSRDTAAEGWGRFVHRVVPELLRDGWRVEIATNFRHRVVDASGTWNATLIEESAQRWFELDLGITVDGERIALLPIMIDLLQRMRHTSPDAAGALDDDVFGHLDNGTLIAIPAERFRTVVATLLELFSTDALNADARLPVSLATLATLEPLEATTSFDWRGGERLRAAAQAVRDGEIEERAVPTTLVAELRPYQRTGMSWLSLLRSHSLGGILADDMGLGKTIQTLAHLLAEKAAGRLDVPALVITPTSVIPNWQAEFARFAPTLRVLTLHGAQRARHHDALDDTDVVLTSYPLLLRDHDVLVPRTWSIVVLDEAQAIKNVQSKVAKSALQLRAAQRIALTGTPIENHLEELWSIATFAVPGLLGERRAFNRVFRVPIEKHDDTSKRALLAQRMRPFVLRRTKEEVARDLPEKSEIVVRVELAEKQRDLYETVRLAVHANVLREIDTRGFSRSHIAVLDALMKLRQVCCDPRLVKLKSARTVHESAKLDLLLEMLPELLADGRRVLLFSQFTSMLDLIAPELDARAIPYVELRGTTKDRATPVARFQNGEVPLFLLSLKAGGTGLNLTAADTVIHYDPWWNPAVERQATDRAHRIGQTEHVFVYKFITVGTVEERITEMQARKGALAEALFDPAATRGAAFGAADLNELFAPIA